MGVDTRGVGGGMRHIEKYCYVEVLNVSELF